MRFTKSIIVGTMTFLILSVAYAGPTFRSKQELISAAQNLLVQAGLNAQDVKIRLSLDPLDYLFDGYAEMISWFSKSVADSRLHVIRYNIQFRVPVKDYFMAYDCALEIQPTLHKIVINHCNAFLEKPVGYYAELASGPIN